MKKLILSLGLVAAFATASFASPPAGSHKNSGPAPRVTVVQPKSVTVNRVHVAPITSVHVQRSAPAVRVNANINLGPARVATRININPAPRYVNYNLTHGVRFAQGTYYRGRDHRHWSYQRWDPRYRCYLYFDPCVRSWYYWNQPMACYYPVSYCPTGSYSSPIAAQPLPDVPMFPTSAGEPINAPIDMTFPGDNELPPIPAPMFPQ